MALGKDKTAITIAIENEDLAIIDAIADKLSLSRSAILRNVIKSGLEDLRTLDVMKVTDIVGMIRRQSESPERIGAARPRARTVPAVD